MLNDQRHPGYFISFEGIDGAGKSTAIKRLEKDLTERGFDLLVTRDPPYDPYELKPWNILKDYFQFELGVDPEADVYVSLGVRVDHCKRRIAPALKKGMVVLSDRYVDSWLAAHSIRTKQEFDGNKDTALEWLLEQLNSARSIFLPDLTILFSQDPEVAYSRLPKDPGDKVSKYHNLPFLIECEERYQVLARRFPSRIKQIDVRDLSRDEVYEKVYSVVINFIFSQR